MKGFARRAAGSLALWARGPAPAREKYGAARRRKRPLETNVWAPSFL